MIGDNIELKDEYYSTAEALFNRLEKVLTTTSKFVVAIGGESGSGKTVTALCLQELLEKNNYAAAVFHIDDYFFLPPQSNHQKRLESIENVGAHEVNFDLLNENIKAFKKGCEQLEKPLVNYAENSIASETVLLKDVSVLIVEGTYSFLVERADYKIFMSRNYIETKQSREARKRGNEASDPYNNIVLEVEHQLIHPLKEKANAIVDFNYKVKDGNNE